MPERFFSHCSRARLSGIVDGRARDTCRCCFANPAKAPPGQRRDNAVVRRPIRDQHDPDGNVCIDCGSMTTGMGQYRDKAAMVVQSRITFAVISACKSTTYTRHKLGRGGNGRCFVASLRMPHARRV